MEEEQGLQSLSHRKPPQARQGFILLTYRAGRGQDPHTAGILLSTTRVVISG